MDTEALEGGRGEDTRGKPLLGGSLHQHQDGTVSPQNPPAEALTAGASDVAESGNEAFRR